MNNDLVSAEERLERFADKDLAQEFASFLALFSNSMRLRLLCRLVCGGRASVNELAEWASEPQPSISRQMKTLWMARIVNREKVGARAFYSVSDPAVIEMMKFMSLIAPKITMPPGWSG